MDLHYKACVGCLKQKNMLGHFSRGMTNVQWWERVILS